MKKAVKYLSGLVFVFMLSGCIPEQKVIWSSDGNQAVVLSDGGLYRCDPDGTLSEKLLDGVVRVAWRKDSKGLVLARIEEISSWDAATKLLSPDEARKLADVGEALYASYVQLQDIDAAKNVVLSQSRVSENQQLAVGLYLMQQHPELATDVLKLEDPADPVEMQVVQLATLQASGLQTGKILCGSADGIWDLRVSPRDDAVAFSVGNISEGQEAPFRLYVAPLDETGRCIRVASGVSFFPDWSKEGHYLAYAASNIQGGSDDDLTLGAIARRQVADENGLLEQMPEQEDLVGIIMSPFVRVRYLPDNSIMFAAFEVQLPAVVGDMPDYMNFYRFDPTRTAVAERMFPRSVDSFLGETSMLFEPSPDGRKIAIIDAEERAVIVTVATGELQVIPNSSSDVFLPSWRGNDELTCFCTVKDEQSGEARDVVVRYSKDRDPAAVELSASWPEDVL